MLHGHTKIELKNEKTGDIQVVEKDNMITNALSNLFNEINHILGPEYYNSILLPLYQKGLAGIVLFENTIEENINTIISPHATNNVIGYANDTVNSGTNTQQGSINLVESQKLSNGYKFVYDFTTSQANGQISTICLTNKDYYSVLPNNNFLLNVGYSAIIKADTVSDTIISYYNWDSHIFTKVKRINDYSIKVVKYKLILGNAYIGVVDSFFSTNIIDEKTYTYTESLFSSSNYYIICGDYIYIFKWDNTSVYRINKDSLTLDSDWSGNIPFPSGTSRVNHDLITSDDNYLYIGYYKYNYSSADNNYTICKIEPENKTVEKTISLGYEHGNLNYIKHLNVLIRNDDNNKKLIVYDLDLNILYTTTSYGGFAYKKVFSANPNNGIYLLADTNTPNSGIINLLTLPIYIATINNLDSPVIKTSEQSMKITYTITEE